MSKKDWRTLQAYLDTGMSPEECRRLRDENNELRQMAAAKGRDPKNENKPPVTAITK